MVIYGSSDITTHHAPSCTPKHKPYLVDVGFNLFGGHGALVDVG